MRAAIGTLLTLLTLLTLTTATAARPLRETHWTQQSPTPQLQPSDFNNCIDTDIRGIEELRATLNTIVDFDITQNKTNVPFGLLEEDWERLKLLETRLPDDSPLKSKLVNAFRLLIAAIYRLHMKSMEITNSTDDEKFANDYSKKTFAVTISYLSVEPVTEIYNQTDSSVTISTISKPSRDDTDNEGAESEQDVSFVPYITSTDNNKFSNISIDNIGENTDEGKYEQDYNSKENMETTELPDITTLDYDTEPSTEANTISEERQNSTLLPSSTHDNEYDSFTSSVPPDDKDPWAVRGIEKSVTPLQKIDELSSSKPTFQNTEGGDYSETSVNIQTQRDTSTENLLIYTETDSTSQPSSRNLSTTEPTSETSMTNTDYFEPTSTTGKGYKIPLIDNCGNFIPIIKFDNKQYLDPGDCFPVFRKLPVTDKEITSTSKPSQEIIDNISTIVASSVSYDLSTDMEIKTAEETEGISNTLDRIEIKSQAPEDKLNTENGTSKFYSWYTKQPEIMAEDDESTQTDYSSVQDYVTESNYTQLETFSNIVLVDSSTTSEHFSEYNKIEERVEGTTIPANVTIPTLVTDKGFDDDSHNYTRSQTSSSLKPEYSATTSEGFFEYNRIYDQVNNTASPASTDVVTHTNLDKLLNTVKVKVVPNTTLTEMFRTFTVVFPKQTKEPSPTTELNKLMIYTIGDKQTFNQSLPRESGQPLSRQHNCRSKNSCAKVPNIQFYHPKHYEIHVQPKVNIGKQLMGSTTEQSDTNSLMWWYKIKALRKTP